MLGESNRLHYKTVEFNDGDYNFHSSFDTVDWHQRPGDDEMRSSLSTNAKAINC
jgi:hypothetical protein